MYVYSVLFVYLHFQFSATQSGYQTIQQYQALQCYLLLAFSVTLLLRRSSNFDIDVVSAENKAEQADRSALLAQLTS